MIFDICKELRVEVTFTTAQKTSLILPDLRPNQFIEGCRRKPGLKTDSFVVSALVDVESMLGRTEFGAHCTIIATGLDVLSLNVLPKSGFVLGGPQTILALPTIPSFGHLLSYSLVVI